MPSISMHYTFSTHNTHNSWLVDEFSSSNILLGQDFESAAREWIVQGAADSASEGAYGEVYANAYTEDLPHAYFNGTKALSGG